MQWVKPEGSLEGAARDSDQCRVEAMQEAFRRSWMSPWAFAPPMVLRDAQGRRFTVWPMHDPFQDRFLEESRLATFCMRAKGYELRAVDPGT